MFLMREKGRSLLVLVERAAAGTGGVGLTHLACERDWGWRGEVVHP
jgi:hypothetical protein